MLETWRFFRNDHSIDDIKALQEEARLRDQLLAYATGLGSEQAFEVLRAEQANRLIGQIREQRLRHGHVTGKHSKSAKMCQELPFQDGLPDWDDVHRHLKNAAEILGKDAFRNDENWKALAKKIDRELD